MNDEHRYDDQEVAEILERATASEAAGAPLSLPAEHGLTLPQLQEIGSEAGIAPARIAEAARSLASRDVAGAPSRFLGVPRSVSRVVPIERALDDDEWARLVADLRYTFGAEGRVRQHGARRSWSNGNLHVHVEPDAGAYRVRMETLKGDAGPYIGIGVSVILTAIVLLLVSILADTGVAEVIIAGFLGVGGVGLLASVRAMLPRWADERAAQMEGLAERIPRLLEESS